MKNYIDFLNRYKLFVIITISAMILLFSISLKDLVLEGSYRVWFAKDSKILKHYDDFRDVFGNDDSITITFKDENGIFNQKALQSINRITQKLWETKYIIKVTSLNNFQYIDVNKDEPDDIVVEDFILNINNEDEKYLKNRKKIALNDPQLVNSLISKDGKTTMIVARLIPNAGEKEDISFELMSYINKIVKDEVKITGYKYWINGGAAVTISFVEVAKNDGLKFLFLVVFCVMLLLYLIFKKVSAALIPIIIVIFTIAFVFSLQVVLGYKINNFTANIPVFVVAIAVADCVHIYFVWLMLRKEGVDNIDAVTQTLSKNIVPIFLTSLTTSVGFASLIISDIVPILTLGLAAASAAVIAFLLSITLMPTFLLFFRNEVQIKIYDKNNNIKIDKIYDRYVLFIVNNYKKILISTLIIFIIMSLGLFQVKIDSNTIKYFDKDIEVRKSTYFIMNNITGPMPYEIIVDSKIKDGIKNPEFLNKVQEFYNDFNTQFKDVRHITSLLDTVKRFNQVMHENNSSYYKVPNSKELVAQYLLLYAFSLPKGMELNDKMDIKERFLRITAHVNLLNTSQDLKIINWIKKWWKDTKYSVEVNGRTNMFAQMQKDVSDTLIYSIAIALSVVSIIMLIIFKNIKLLYIFILPNILPIVLVVGVMGWIGITIDIGVAISAAIVLGVAVDDSIHFFSKYFYAKNTLNLKIEDRFIYVLKYAGTAILFTTIILVISFLLFLGSDFTPNYNFGIITAIALTIALIADLLLLPSLLMLMEKKTVRKS